MFEKIDIREIVTRHCATLRNHATGKYAPADFIVFFLLPAGLASAGVILDLSLPSSASTMLATGLSIFAALLFNLLLLVADVAVRAEDFTQPGKRRLRSIRLTVLKELHSNISFGVLLALIDLIALLALAVEGPIPGRWIAEWTVFFSSILFFLTLLMILKRAHRLLYHEISEVEKKAS